MPSSEEQFLSFIDCCIEDDPSLVVPADEEQLKRLAKILGIARQGIETYSDALKPPWDEYCEASLDLSNQDDIGEAGAIAALDKLYANNDEGMKRLADS